jgi:hypothetical protein
MNFRAIFVMGILLLCAVSGFAQSEQAASAPAMNFPTMLNVPLAPCLPFTGDVLSEYARIESDGNRVVTQTPGRVMRDASGRTRSEFQTPGATVGSRPQLVPPVENVVIMDPALQVLIELNPQQKIATVRRSNNIVAEATCAMKPPVVAQSAPSVNENSMQTFPDGSTVATESLGTKNIEGFTVPGIRHVYTRAGGATAVGEDWYSPDLQMELVKSQGDSQFQRSLTVLNVQLVEPEENLFQAPPDYTVRDERAQD